MPAWIFADQLTRFGPAATPWAGSLHAARAYCAGVTRSHSENFAVASVFLPRRLVPHFQAVYAYCRWADDLADEAGGGDRALGLLAWWRGELLACYAGDVRHPVFAALRETIRRFDIPPRPFLDLLSAFEQDQRVTRYATFAAVSDYCRRSADPVGRLVLYLCGAFTEDNAILSDHICTGLQLTNFWQDVRRDSETLGRVYLPEEDRSRFGYADADLAAKRFTPAFRDLMQFEVTRTRQFFDAGGPLLGKLPRDVRPDIALFLRGGRAVLDRIAAQDYDVWAARPRLSTAAKAKLVAATVWDRVAGRLR